MKKYGGVHTITYSVTRIIHVMSDVAIIKCVIFIMSTSFVIIASVSKGEVVSGPWGMGGCSRWGDKGKKFWARSRESKGLGQQETVVVGIAHLQPFHHFHVLDAHKKYQTIHHLIPSLYTIP